MEGYLGKTSPVYVLALECFSIFHSRLTLCKTDGRKLRRITSSACNDHAPYYCFSKGSWVLYPQLHHGLDLADVVATSLNYNSADGYEFVQAEEGTEHKSNLLNK